MNTQRTLTRLWLVALSIGLLLALVAQQSQRFEYTQPLSGRPILLIVVLLGIATALYLLAATWAGSLPRDRQLFHLVWIPSLLFRLLLLPSDPIQEVDLYRYLWDGTVIAQGVSPYRFSPQQVIDVDLESSSERDDLTTLARARDRSQSTGVILQRVHYGEIRTVYPPISQVFFALSAWLSPEQSSVEMRRLTIKAILMVMDLLTLAAVWWVLPRVGVPSGKAILYGWCPLLLKEFSNSGHLDAIAVCFTTLAVVALLYFVESGSSRSMGLSVLLLALGTGAKLFPVALAPLWFVVVVKRSGIWRSAMAMAGFVALACLFLWPMFADPARSQPSSISASSRTQSQVDPMLETPPIPEPHGSDSSAPSGLKEFLSHWEMNDFFFVLLLENIRPEVPHVDTKWFAIVPAAARQWISERTAEVMGTQPQPAAFFLSRAITLAIWSIIALVSAARIRCEDPRSIVEASGITLAWFFLLSPTLNPWYWTWTLPFVAAMRNRAWLLVSGWLLIYYLRFWVGYEHRYLDIAGNRFSGYALYDHVIVFVTWSSFFVVLAMSAVFARRKDCG